MCFTDWYNYKIRSPKYTFLFIPLSHKVPKEHGYLSAFVQTRQVAFEATLQITHPAWAFGCIVGQSWSM